MKNRHELLDRQLRDATGASGELDQAKFLDAVSAAYQRYDEDGERARHDPEFIRNGASRTDAAPIEDEQVFRDFAAAVSDRFWETDRKFRFTRRWTSKNTEFTLKDKEFIGKFIWDRYRICEGSSETRHLKEILETRKPFRDVDIELHPIAEKRLFRRLNATPYFDDAGEFLGYRGAAKDITEELNLRNLSADLFTRLESVINNSPSAIVLKDLEGRYQMVNQRFAEWHGFSREAMIGKTLADIMPDDLARSLLEQDRTVIETGKIIEGEQEIETADGHRLPVYVTKFPVFNQAGQLTGVGANMTDITERKLVEAALGDSEIMFRTTFEQTAVGMAIRAVDPRESLWLEVNQKFCDILGYTREELLNMTSVEISVPEERHTAIEHNERLLRGEITSYSREKRYVRKDGKIIWTSIWLSTVVDADGKPTKIISAVEDITERKNAESALRESEERLRAFMDNSPSAILVKDNEGRYVMANKCWHDWFNPDGRDITGKALLDFHPEAEVDEIVRADQEILETGQPVEKEILTTLADGSHRTMLLQKFPIFDGDGAVAAIGGINTDITKYKAMEEQLAQAQKLEAVGKLTGGVAHDFNNLLTIIQGNAQLLAHKAKGLENLTEPILRASRRGAELTQRLLAFSRRQPLRPSPISLSALVDDMLDLLRRTLGETVEISVSLAPDLWPALADAGQVENALLNLAINSRDAMREGGKLTIACANAEAGANAEAPNTDYAVISVSDTGTGMSAEVREHAFEPFFTTKEVGQGSGLGLSMVHGFVNQSGGFVTLDSEEGRGTTVRLHLPRAAQLSPERHEAPVEEARHGNRELILLIEDEAEVRELAIKVLENLGYRVVAASNASEAGDALESDPPPDLILSDVVLTGGVSGPEFVVAARKRHPGIKVIFMSGYPAEALTDNRALGQDDVLLTKPFDMEDLANHLRDAFDAENTKFPHN